MDNLTIIRIQTMDLNGGCRPIYALKAQKAGNCLIKQECIPVGCVPPAHRLYLPGPGAGGRGDIIID